MKYIILFLTLFAPIGCTTTRTITQTVNVHDTLYHAVTRHDSIHVKDSIYITEKVKGDTTYITTDRWHTKYKELMSHDSIYIHLTDTVYEAVPVEVAPKESWTTKLQKAVGFGIIWSIILLVLYYIVTYWRCK